MAAKPNPTVKGEPRDPRNITQILRTYGGDGGNKRNFSSLAVADNGTIFATTAGNDVIFILDKSDSSSFRLSIGSSCLGGMTLFPEPGTGEWSIAVSAFSSGHVHLFSPDGRVLKKLVSAPMRGPNGLALHDGKLYVCESQANCVSVFNTDGERLHQFGSKGEGEGEFSWPHQICVGPDDLLYVSDMNNNRIEVFEKDGTFIRQFGKDILIRPIGVRITPSGHVAVVSRDNNRLVFFTTNGKCVQILEHISLQEPCGLDIDKNGFLYVADSRNGRICML